MQLKINPDQWNGLPKLTRWLIFAHIAAAWLYHRRYLPLGASLRNMPFPLKFSLRVSLITFGYLLFLPAHPLTLPTSLGSSLAFNLLWLAFQRRPGHWPVVKVI